MVYYNTDADDVTGRMEHAYQTLVEIEPLWQKFKKAEHQDSFEGLTFEDHVVHASQNGGITEEEAEVLIQYNAMRFDSLLTDTFDEHLSEALERDNPHALENAVHQLTDYAQLKRQAQSKNGIAVDTDAAAAAAEELATNEPTINDLDSPANTDNHTGDANPNHGYESDGDVELVSEQDTIKEVNSQTDFEESEPEREALDHRHRDAESHLNERMGNNHNRHIAPPDENNTEVSDNNIKPLEHQSPLSREENDKV
jgi:acyl-CoA dehydrogenase